MAAPKLPPPPLGAPTLANFSASLITPTLTQGSRPPVGSFLRRHGYTAVALCAKEYQPDRLYYPGVVVIRAHLDDDFARGPTTREEDEACFAAKQVAFHSAVGKRVFVSCYMGLNRSGLVMALALYRLTGWPGRRVLDYVRARRPKALSNPWFAAAIDRLPALPEGFRQDKLEELRALEG